MFFAVAETTKYFLSLYMGRTKKTTDKISKATVDNGALHNNESPQEIYEVPRFIRDFYE